MINYNASALILCQGIFMFLQNFAEFGFWLVITFIF